MTNMRYVIESKDWLEQYQQQYDRCFNSASIIGFFGQILFFLPRYWIDWTKRQIPLYVTMSPEILWPNICVFNRIFDFLANYWILQSNIGFFGQILDWLNQKSDCNSINSNLIGFQLCQYFWLFRPNIGLIELKDWLQQYQQQHNRCFNSASIIGFFGQILYFLPKYRIDCIKRLIASLCDNANRNFVAKYFRF